MSIIREVMFHLTWFQKANDVHDIISNVHGITRWCQSVLDHMRLIVRVVVYKGWNSLISIKEIYFGFFMKALRDLFDCDIYSDSTHAVWDARKDFYTSSTTMLCVTSMSHSIDKILTCFKRINYSQTIHKLVQMC